MRRSIKVGVSSCLMGEKTRYNGADKLDRYLTGVLGAHVELVPVCPEVECGMPVPREPMSLRGDPEHPRLVTNLRGGDRTEEMLGFCSRRIAELAKEDLSGFVLKSKSPSCGLSDIPVYGAGGARPGRGIFAAKLLESCPDLPVEDEERLGDPALRENFVERIFAYRRWQDFLADAPDLGKLVQFHSCNKLVVMAHSVALYREIGRLLGQGGELEWTELLRRYQESFLRALRLPATVKKQTNVLQHVAGYFKKQLTATEKEELLQAVAGYHREMVPLLVPLTLLGHYANKYHQEYLQQQCYLFPHPAELMLRNHP